MLLETLSAVSKFVPWQAIGCAIGTALEAAFG